MKKWTRGMIGTGLAAVLAVSLAACGSEAQTQTEVQAQSQAAEEQAQETAAEGTGDATPTEGAGSSETDALVDELLERYVTPDDPVTKEIVEAAIARLKEKYSFETDDAFKIQSTNWAYVAQGEGWFEDLLGDNGTKVEVVEGSIGSEPQLMARGELDLANRMLYPYLLFKTQGAEITAVGISADPRPEIVSVLVNKDSEYQTFSDLKGATIGSWNAGCQYVALIELTEDEGWKIDEDWTYANISNDSLKTALQAKEIDAISVHPLTTFNGSIIDGSFREIANAKPNGTYTNYGGASVSFVPNKVADEEPNIVNAILKLRELVNAYILLYPEETGATVEAVTRVPAENTNFWNDRSSETFFASQQSLSELISDTDEYQNWLIEHTEEFTEENRVDSADYFNSNFIK